MKRTAKIFFTISILSILMTLTGCFSPIFYELRKDVKPETPTVSGNIPTITRFTTDNKYEFLFLSADNGLRFKRADNESHGSWGEYPLPFELTHFDFDDTEIKGQQIITVIANYDTLYVVSAEYRTTGSDGRSIPNKVNLWGKKIQSDGDSVSLDGEWTHINKNLPDLFTLTYDEDEGTVESNFNFFQTNAPMAIHRHAYFCAYDASTKTYRYYELNGISAPVEFTIGKAFNSDIEANKEDGRVYSAVYYNGSIKFLTSSAATTNETYTTEATKVYFGDDYDLKYISGSTIIKITESKGMISAIATCADSILVGFGDLSGGGSGGIQKVILQSNGLPEDGYSSFSTNANFQITDGYHVMALLNATPEKNETDSALYATITFINKNGVYDNIGLWSYYPSRGNWNRE